MAKRQPVRAFKVYRRGYISSIDKRAVTGPELNAKNQETAYGVLHRTAYGETPLRIKIAANHLGFVPRFDNRRHDADRQIFLRFPETVHAGAETGDGDLGCGVHGENRG